MKPVAILAAVAVVVVLLGAGVALSRAKAEVVQPIGFDHRLHVEDLGAGCTDCHLYAESGLRATIPNVEVCSACHAEALTDSPDEARVVEHVEADRPIRWRKIYWVPDHVFFSHRRHTAVAGIDCEQCHGAVAERERPLRRPLVPQTMDRCMDCHERTGASNDCIVCHR